LLKEITIKANNNNYTADPITIKTQFELLRAGLVKSLESV